ncbi:MAG: formylglycine-generating enzyme family protein [Xenococcus sp. MO_188.B8]|nr:formylglycine-generating enzyme family protein [Xenococcus sp. MO_188.B8]
MIAIPGGTFKMGSPGDEGSDYEKPQHEVTVSSFYMGKYTITQAQYQKLMGNNPSKFRGNNQRHVEQVSWDDAVEFCQRLSKQTGKEYRLPYQLYEQISAIALEHFHAKTHHRSGKPEVSPTILQLIEIGIAQFESTLPQSSATAGLREEIEELRTRLTIVESKLSQMPSGKTKAAPEPEFDPSDRGLSDSELARLINLSSSLIRRYRLDGKATPRVVETLKEWEVQGDRWLRIDA